MAATNKWRFFKTPPSNARTHCTRCRSAIVETIAHCLWEHPRARVIWDWVTFLGPITSQDIDQDFSSTLSQSLIGEPIVDLCTIPQRWWRVLRLVAMWFIWTARNSESIPKVHVPIVVTKASIWNQIRITLRLNGRRKGRKGWSRHRRRCRQFTISNSSMAATTMSTLLTELKFWSREFRRNPTRV